MINSLYIKNYRNLKELSIKSLGRVNLITGKNNTGKSTILEAIAIYASRGDLTTLYQLLEERGESFKRIESSANSIQSNIKIISSLFCNRVVNFTKNDAIVIGILENTLFGEEQSNEKTLSFRFVKYFDEEQKDNDGSIIRRRKIELESEIEKDFGSFKIGLEIRLGNNYSILSLEDGRLPRYGFRGLANNDTFQFIRTKNIDREINGKLWDNITLTEKESNIIEALKIIEPLTERIAFIEDGSKERTAVIKLSSSQSILPVRSMGDGTNRILTIILALVNADNGYLLIDEFENGLHYSVQEKLWEIIFSLAEKLNVQVFATTHSEDCIEGFEQILNSPKNSLEGKLIRLDNKNGTIKQVEFSAKELKIASDNNIETR